MHCFFLAGEALEGELLAIAVDVVCFVVMVGLGCKLSVLMKCGDYMN